MTYAFVSSRLPPDAVRQATIALQTEGVEPTKTRIGPSLEAFVRLLPAGSVVVVYSVDFFPSLAELLAALLRLSERRITLRSLCEPWLSDEVESKHAFIAHLHELSTTIHTTRTQRGLDKARAEGKRLGRPSAKERQRTTLKKR